MSNEPQMVHVSVDTYKPEKYLLVDRETGNQWEIRDGTWKRAEAQIRLT